MNKWFSYIKRFAFTVLATAVFALPFSARSALASLFTTADVYKNPPVENLVAQPPPLATYRVKATNKLDPNAPNMAATKIFKFAKSRITRAYDNKTAKAASAMTGMCTHYVVDHVRAGGVALKSSDAIDLPANLKAVKFTPVPQDEFTPIPNDVAVIVFRDKGRLYQHSAIYTLNTHWYSDVEQKKRFKGTKLEKYEAWPYKKEIPFRADSFSFFRNADLARPDIQQTPWVFADASYLGTVPTSSIKEKRNGNTLLASDAAAGFAFAYAPVAHSYAMHIDDIERQRQHKQNVFEWHTNEMMCKVLAANAPLPSFSSTSQLTPHATLGATMASLGSMSHALPTAAEGPVKFFVPPPIRSRRPNAGTTNQSKTTTQDLAPTPAEDGSVILSHLRAQWREARRAVRDRNAAIKIGESPLKAEKKLKASVRQIHLDLPKIMRFDPLTGLDAAIYTYNKYNDATLFTSKNTERKKREILNLIHKNMVAISAQDTKAGTRAAKFVFAKGGKGRLREKVRPHTQLSTSVGLTP